MIVAKTSKKERFVKQTFQLLPWYTMALQKHNIIPKLPRTLGQTVTIINLQNGNHNHLGFYKPESGRDCAARKHHDAEC